MIVQFKRPSSPLNHRTVGPVLVLLAATVVLSLPSPCRAGDDDPLAPPDTSSPRATLKSFLESFEAAFRPFYDGKSDRTPYRTPAQIRSVRTIDLSKIPPLEARRTATETSILLYEVLARIELPAEDDIPGVEAMEALPPGKPSQWRIPGTDIVIAEVTEGDRFGEFLFSPSTVEHAGDFYERVRHLDYRSGAMEGLYERLSYTPGSAIPVRWIEGLPAWLKRPLLGQSAWKWFAAVLLLALWMPVIALAHVWTRRRGEQDRYWLRCVAAIALMPLTHWLFQFLANQVIVLGWAFNALEIILASAFYLFGAVAIFNFGSGVANRIIASPRIDPGSIDAHLIELLCQTVAWIAIIGLIMKAASDFGIPLAAVIASLGVGGLAVALAARTTLEDLIAGVALYLDRPVRVGQWCRFKDTIGMVEQIGLRSTRIRHWDGYQITVPNSHFAEYDLDNFDDARDIFIRKRVHLRYETTPDQLRFILAKTSEMLSAHPKVKWPRVRLADLGEYALVMELRAHVDTTWWSIWHAVREDIYLRTLEIIHEAGSAIAVPSRTTYVAQDKGVDEERGRAAEQTVEQWRETGKLPFPDMAEERSDALAGTLDYPPQGSVQLEGDKKSE